MSQFSETTSSPSSLGFAEERTNNGYYTARISETMGVCVAKMSSVMMVQFFPWGMGDGGHGHSHYAAFITAKATTTAAQNNELFQKYPFFTTPENDILMIKCLIEDTIKNLNSDTEHP